MIVQHNLPSMNATRQLKLTGGSLQKATEKLSSGYKINRAGDNAAGLAISEKMRAQIRGLDQASNNSQDGISLIQTAEGALNETHSILQRMRELAVQAASDTNTDDDRTKIQDEISQLTQEVDRIANTTEFNTKKLLNGDQEGARVAEDGTVKVEGNFSNGSVKVEFVGMKDSKADLDAKKEVTKNALDGLEGEYKTLTDKINSEVEKLNALGDGVAGFTAVVFNTYDGGTGGDFGAAWDDTLTITSSAERVTEFEKIRANITNLVTRKNELDGADDGTGKFEDAVADLDTGEPAAAAPANDSALYTAANKAYAAALAADNTTQDDGAKDVETTDVVRITVEQGVIDAENDLTGLKKEEPKLFDADNLFGTTYTSTNGDVTGKSSKGGIMLIEVGNAILKVTNADKLKAGDNITISLNEAVKPRDADSTNKDGVKLQIGANASQEMQMRINSMKADDLKISKNGVAFDVTNQTGASMAIEAYDMAIQKVSRERAKMGAIQNRLEHTIANLDTASENLSAAESRIRDTDMAKTMTEYSKNNILQQAGQSMLAQANQQTQGVLTLLR